jgi:flavin reductase (DIM6/NTAB) family NADH-FMN oxidoreductase RutF
MIVDCEDKSARSLYELLITAVVPRPIAWVSTRGKDGTDNLAPFSFFNLFSTNPPILGFAPGLKRSPDSASPVPKDTLRNVIETEEFVVNIVNMELAHKMVQSSGDYAKNVSEFSATRLTAAPSTKVRPPRVGEAPISMECRLFQIVELGSNKLVLGRIVCVHVNDTVLEGNSVNVEKLQPVARLGGDLYSVVKDPFSIERPKIEI